MVDADDVASSAGRRLLAVCSDGRFGDFYENDLETYIFRTAMNVAEDKIRAERTRHETLARIWRENVGSAVESVAISLPDDDTIAAALSRLDEDDRKIFDLQLRGVPHREIAKQLGLTMTVYYARRHRLAKHLREHFRVPLTR